MQANQEQAIRDLQKSIQSLQQRISRIECQLLAEEDAASAHGLHACPEQAVLEEPTLSKIEAVKTEAPLDTSESEPAVHPFAELNLQVSPVALANQNVDSGKTSDRDDSDHAKQSEESQNANSSLEAKIGLYWLSRLGVGFLVVGVSLLIMYSFQYFGAWAKIFTGFAISGILLSLGEYLDQKQKMRWYGNALAGGGWSLAYFTSYAMHHVDVVKVVDDPITGSSLMLLVAGAAMMQSFNKNSELVATLAIMLGYLTIGLSELGPFSVVASVILTACLSFMVHKKKWTGLYSIGTLSAFASSLFAADFHRTIPGIGTELGLIVPYWLASALLPFCFIDEKSEKSKGLAVCVAIVSAIATYYALIPALAPIVQNADACLFAFFATAYSGVGMAMKRKNYSSLASINSLLALSSIALFIPAIYSGPSQLTAWAVQLALILWAGLKYNLKSFRWFSFPLSLVLFCGCLMHLTNGSAFTFAGMNLHWAAIDILPGALVFAAAAGALHMGKFKISETARELAFYWYLHLAAISWFCFIPALVYSFDHISNSAQTVILIGWSVQSLFLGLLALLWKRSYLVIPSLIGLISVFTSSMSIVAIPEHITVILLAISMTFALALKAKNSADAKNSAIYEVYFVYAAIWLFCYQVHAISSPQLSAYAVAAETLAYIYLGIKRNDILMRSCGVLSGCALLTKLVFDPSLDWNAFLPSIAAIYGSAELYRSFKPEGKKIRTRQMVRDVFNIAATFALTSYIGWHLNSYFVSCAWAIEGLALLAAGFILSDKLIRISGLTVFGILVLRLFLVDLSGAETIYRIIAFIVAGIMLMLAAYSYNWFSKKLVNEVHS